MHDHKEHLENICPVLILHNIAESDKSYDKGLTSFNTFVVYVTRINCIISSLNWIIVGYKTVLTL